MTKLTILKIFLFVISITCGNYFCMNAYCNSPGTPIIPINGSELHTLVSFSESAIKDIDCQSRSINFDPTLFIDNTIGDASIYIKGDTLSYIENSTKYLFKLSSDSLSYIGFENRFSNFRLDSPSFVINYNFQNNYQTSSRWEGESTLYGKNLLKNAVGHSSSIVEKGWNLVSDNDTIPDITSVIWDFTLSAIDNDSINAYDRQSGIEGKLSDYNLPIDSILNEHYLTRRELWYSSSSPYPILQRSRSFLIRHIDPSNSDTIPISTFSQYYPSSLQYADMGRESEWQNLKYNTYGNRNPGDYVAENSNTNTTISKIGYNGSEVEVTIHNNTGKEKVSLTVYLNSGIQLTESTTIEIGEIPLTYHIPIPKDISGVLVILLESSSGNVAKKIII